MALAESNVNVRRAPLAKESIDYLTKKSYGLNDKNLEEIYVFINDFEEVLVNTKLDNTTHDDLRPIVDKCNKIPAHCGFIVANYFVNNHGDAIYNKILANIYNIYTQMNENDPENTKTTDLYETLACLIAFAPARTIRNFISNNFELSKKIYLIMRKRPGTDAVMSARYAELFLTSKGDKKYADTIYENYKAMLDFLSTKNGEIEGITDSVKINFNELRDIMVDYHNRNKKESLRLINKLINKKADIGEAFFYWIILNPSCAIEVITRDSRFDGEFIESFLYQLKVQYVAELVTMIEALPDEKKTYMDYVMRSYKMKDMDDCFDKLSKVLKKGGMSSYGTLMRQVSLYPNITIDKDSNFGFVAKTLRSKLSSIANNLTADISEKSMSITIVPLGRSRTYQDIMDKIEGFDENDTNSFVAKMREKDIVKRIRESGLSWYTLDQNCGTMMITILHVISEIYDKMPDINEKKMIESVYKEVILKYGFIITLPYFKYIIDNLTLKAVSSTSDQTGEEDYEDIV